jgi:hypothetical protein
MLMVLHSGQTGVERGAHRAAIAAGIAVAGFMPLDHRDELGPLPADVAEALTPCFDRGPRPAVRANIAIASGVLLVVPDATRAAAFTAVGAVIQAARAERVPVLAADASTNLGTILDWVHQLRETSGSTRLLVTGPRSTRWTDGEALARRIVGAIGLG